MKFRIAATFYDSYSKLTGEEKKAVWSTNFELQRYPASLPKGSHKIDQAKDKNFWSVRVSDNIRMIVHRLDDSLLLCYVAHHENAYKWAERRKIETHPKTGAAQLVEVRETIQEIMVPRYVQETPPKPPLLADVSNDSLLSYGVPPEWLNDVRQTNEDTLLSLDGHLPSEAFEALMDIATGGKPEVAKPVASGTDPFTHPDAQLRFPVVKNIDELQRSLDGPWEKRSEFKCIVFNLRKVFRNVFKCEGRPFGQKGRSHGISDGADGVQWNTWTDPKDLKCTFSVNLEGVKCESNWPLARLLLQEQKKVELFQYISQLDVESKRKTIINLILEAWQVQARPAIDEADALLTPIPICELTPKIWNKALENGLQCYIITDKLIKKAYREVTLSKSKQKVTRLV